MNMYDLCLGCRGQKMACKAAGKWQCMEHGVSCEVTRPCPSLAAIKDAGPKHKGRHAQGESETGDDSIEEQILGE